MKKFLLPALLLLIMQHGVAQTTLYVSPTGLATNPGTLASPTTLQNALTTIPAGGTIFMRGGTYNYTATILIARTNSGSAGSLKKIYAYNNEVPILSFAGMAVNGSNRGIILDALYWHLRGLIIEGAGDNGILLSGNNNIVERCIFRGNADTGLQLSRYTTSYTTISQWPMDNLILDCEAYDNKDPGNENADGFAAKLTCGTGNVFRNCVAHHNIDDGWDLYTKSDTGPIGAILLENCIAHSNGTLTTGTSSGNGDKNGFKLGGEDIGVNHIVRRCIAFNNGKHGFTYNRNLGTMEVSNNAGYNNAERNFNFDGGTSVFRNNLSYFSSSHTNDRIIGTQVGTSNAFWTNNASANFTVNSADFVSLTPGANANPTGNGFFNLAAGSDLINAGVITSGITYAGSAPDIGAVESGVTTTTYTLTATASPTAGGSVSKSPNNSAYNAGTVVTLTATPASGYVFSGWSGGATGTANPINLTMDGNKTVTATFTQSTTTYALTTSVVGQGSVSPGSGTYASGTNVTLTATPASGYVFSGWSGGATGSTNPITITMNSNKAVTATFTQSTTNYTLATTLVGQGSVSPASGTFASGTNVTLTATPASGWQFSSWSGGATGTANPITVNMNGNKSITATFTLISSGGTLRIEDAATFTAGYCSADGSRASSYAGASNGYYVNLSNSSGKGINWRVNAPAAGTYTLTWRYANGGTQSATTARVLVNGTVALASVSFPKTTSWTTWTTTTASVSLTGGDNTIRLETTVSSEFANIDWIEVTGNNPQAASCSSSAREASTAAADMIIDEEGDGFNAFNVSAYPNPAKQQLTVQFQVEQPSAVRFVVYNLLGQAVISLPATRYEKGVHTKELNVGRLPGTYILSVDANDKVSRQRFIVE